MHQTFNEPKNYCLHEQLYNSESGNTENHTVRKEITTKSLGCIQQTVVVYWCRFFGYESLIRWLPLFTQTGVSSVESRYQRLHQQLLFKRIM